MKGAETGRNTATALCNRTEKGEEGKHTTDQHLRAVASSKIRPGATSFFSLRREMLCVIATTFSLAFAPASSLRPSAVILSRAPFVTMAKTVEKPEAKGKFSWDRALGGGNKMKVVVRGAKPRVGRKKMPPDVFELTQNFKKEYSRKELDQLWGAMMACYGTEDAARQAAFDNPQIINPSYSFTNTMLDSRDVLLDMMGKEAALEIMLLNPAVLQCGPSLDTLGPDEIKGFANIRSVSNKIGKRVGNLGIFFLIFVCLSPLVIENTPSLQGGALSNIIKPIVGIIFAVAIEGSRIAIIGTIVKAKASGDERIKKAEENEARRMGKGKPRGGKALK